VSWDLRDDAGFEVTTGMYLVRLETSSGSRTRSVLQLRWTDPTGAPLRGAPTKGGPAYRFLRTSTNQVTLPKRRVSGGGPVVT
jgi:hypothetical protein